MTLFSGIRVSMRIGVIFSRLPITTQTYFIEGDWDGGDGHDEVILSFGYSVPNSPSLPNNGSNNYWYHSWGNNTWYNDSSADVFSVDLSTISLTDIEVVSERF